MHPSSKTSRGHPRLHETKQRSPCRLRIRAMAYCRFPSFCKGPVVFSWLKQTATMVRCWEPSWPWTPYSSNDWPKRLFSRPPLPFRHSHLGLVSWAFPLSLARCPPAAHRSPGYLVNNHSTRSMHQRPCGPVSGNPPLPKPPVPRILGVVKSMRPPSWRTTKMCRRSRIPKSIANTGDHPQTSQGNLRGLSAAFRPFLDVIKL